MGSESVKSKHTPGPWIASGPFGAFKDIGEFHVDSQLGEHVTILCDRNPERAEKRYADAHLIAAAPELLEACRAVLKQLHATGFNDSKAGRLMVQAVAKAEGAA